jgi:hypothetical protein
MKKGQITKKVQARRNFCESFHKILDKHLFASTLNKNIEGWEENHYRTLEIELTKFKNTASRSQP